MTAPRVVAQTYEAAVAIDSLEWHPDNPNEGDVDAIGKSIDEVGFYGAVLVQKSRRRVLAGEHRSRSMAELGGDTVPVIWVDVDDDTADRILAGDNALAALAKRDADALQQLLGRLAESPRGLAGTGYGPDDLTRLLARKVHGGIDPDRLAAAERQTEPPPPAKVRTKPGDLWLLGAHRILCGDARRAADVERLVDDVDVDLVFTSPYRVGVHYSGHDDRPVPWPAYASWLSEVLGAVVPTVRPGGAVCWNIGTSPKTFPHRQATLLEDHGLTYVRQMIWRKVGVPVPSDYHMHRAEAARFFTPNYTHELVLVYAAGDEPEPGTPPLSDDRALAVFTRRPFDPTPTHELVLLYAAGDTLERGGATTFDKILDADVFEIAQSMATRDVPAGPTRSGADSNLDRRSKKAHPAVFPVELPAQFITHLVDVGGAVLDPMAGAGSTLLAAVRTGRRGLALELDPGYVDLACRRYQTLTGDLPRLEGSGEPVNFEP